MITLAKELEDEIRRHGEKTYPEECCGVILGKAEGRGQKTIARLIPIDNAKNMEEKHNRFLITPDDVMQAELTARAYEQDVIGFYHSHPDHPAEPSAFDLDHALPFYSYIIVSIEKGKAKKLTSWEMENDRSRFNPELIIQ